MSRMMALRRDARDIYEGNEDLDNVLRGLLIFAKYQDGKYNLSAEHDVIFVLGEYDLQAHDLANLNELGWHIGEFDCWQHFV